MNTLELSKQLIKMHRYDGANKGEAADFIASYLEKSGLHVEKISSNGVVNIVGSTGLSTAPHVHYEVMKGGEKMNPINYYYNDLTPEQYQKLIELSEQSSQSFD